SGNLAGLGMVRYTGAGNSRDLILDVLGGAVPTQAMTGYLRVDLDLNGVVKYTGAQNDREEILLNIGGSVPTATRFEQLP
ncbi:MAG: hypothetical protein RBT71_06625, partial [Flavobacteriales bacterium]|nr:hypothetical protein [Flavobacteriales bacterium]